MNINFIQQSLLILKQDNYDDDELRMVYDYLLYLDYDILFSYYMNNSIQGYENDLNVYIEAINETLKKYEITEEYEKCHKLKLKRDDTFKIINEYKTN